MSITHTQLTVTPEMAARFLEFNTGNRPLSRGWTTSLARSIINGEWKQTHQSIAFSGDIANPARLLDGQHRLSAIVKAGRPVEVLVAWGVDEATFSVMDDNKTRNFAQRNKWQKDDVTFCSTISHIIDSGLRMNITRAEQVMDRLGPYFRALIIACPTKAKSLSTVGIWVGAVMAMNKTGEVERIAAAYRALVLGDVERMPTSIAALYSLLIRRDADGRSNREFQLQSAFIAFSEFSRKRFNSEVGGEIRNAIIEALSTAHPTNKPEQP